MNEPILKIKKKKYTFFTVDGNYTPTAYTSDDLLYEDALSPLNDFKGEALIVQGEKDITIDPQNGKIIASALCKAKEKKLVFMKNADHGFGLWDGRKRDNERLLEETIRFLSKSL